MDERDFIIKIISSSRTRNNSGSISSQEINGNNRYSKFTERPRSVPASAYSQRKNDIVATYSLNLDTDLGHVNENECDRVSQLGNYKKQRRPASCWSSFRIRKSPQPPWQKNLDSPLVPNIVSPGYVLSRSKSKIFVELNDAELPKENSLESSRSTKTERDDLVTQLQNQIDDLILALEEEKLNHKETKLKAAEKLGFETEELKKYYENKLKLLEETHNNKLLDEEDRHIAEMVDFKMQTENKTNKLQTELDTLKAAFEAYKQQLSLEMNEKTNKSLKGLKQQMEATSAKQLQELRNKMLAEKDFEKTEMENMFQDKLFQLRRDHKRQIEDLAKRFSEKAVDLEQLKQTRTKLNELEDELTKCQDMYRDSCLDLDAMKLEKSALSLKLLDWESSFEDRVKEMDKRYRNQIDEQKTQIAELRLLFMKKCGQLVEKRICENQAIDNRLSSAKETMKVIIETRTRTGVSLAATDLVNSRGKEKKLRPESAPATKKEEENARSIAGATLTTRDLLHL